MSAEEWFKLLLLFVSLAALFQSYFGPRRTTLHSQRIQLTNAALKSSSEYGWKLGSLNGPDRDRITDKELHENNQYEEIVRLFNKLVVDLEMLETIMPDKWLLLLGECQQKLQKLHTTFYSGRFSEQEADFVSYYASMTKLRKKLRPFLTRGLF
jgi:hypothetical protein